MRRRLLPLLLVFVVFGHDGLMATNVHAGELPAESLPAASHGRHVAAAPPADGVASVAPAGPRPDGECATIRFAAPPPVPRHAVDQPIGVGRALLADLGGDGGGPCGWPAPPPSPRVRRALLQVYRI